MSVNLEAAFNYVIGLKGRDMTLHDLDSDTKVTFKIAKANYFRNLEGIEETTISGREFIISKKLLELSGFPSLEKNTRILDPLGGSYTVNSVHEMEGIASILGYRVRTS